MKPVQIKIGLQRQANKPIFLLKSGVLVCGNFKYKGRYRKKFKKYYGLILDNANKKSKKGVLDVSKTVYWDAISIYDGYIVPRWQRSISAGKMRKLANETEIRKIIDDIKPEFKRAVRLKWRKIFKKSDPSDKHTPKRAWQIL